MPRQQTNPKLQIYTNKSASSICGLSGSKNCARTVSEERNWIDWQHPELNVRDEYCLLGLNRSNLYYKPVPETHRNLQIMGMIMRHPCNGHRPTASYLERKDLYVNRSRIQRLMRNMGLKSLAPKAKTDDSLKG